MDAGKLALLHRSMKRPIDLRGSCDVVNLCLCPDDIDPINWHDVLYASPACSRADITPPVFPQRNILRRHIVGVKLTRTVATTQRFVYSLFLLLSGYAVIR
jgi:hypothetical protein